MRFALAVIFSAVLASTAGAQPKVEYDKYTNTTTVTSTLVPLITEDASSIVFCIAYQHTGETPVMPPGIGVGITAMTQRVTYDDCAVLYLIIDGVRSRIPLAHQTRDAGGKWWAEIMTVPFRVSSMKTLAGAQRIEGRLCHREFVLTHKDLAPLRDLLSTIPGIDAVEPTQVGSVD